jgi:hypothetical protein
MKIFLSRKTETVGELHFREKRVCTGIAHASSSFYELRYIV